MAHTYSGLLLSHKIEVLTHVITSMKIEDIILTKTNLLQNYNIWFQLYELSGVVKFIETGNMVAKDLGGRVNTVLNRYEKVLEIDLHNQTIWMHLTILRRAFKHSEEGKFCVICISPQFLKMSLFYRDICQLKSWLWDNRMRFGHNKVIKLLPLTLYCSFSEQMFPIFCLILYNGVWIKFLLSMI